MYKDFLPPPQVNNINLYEQILLEEEEIHNFAELDAKLEKICYRPALWVKVINGILTFLGGMTIGAGVVTGTLAGVASAKAANLGTASTVFAGVGGALGGLLFSSLVVLLKYFIPGLIFNHIVKLCSKNVVNSNAPKDEKIKCIQEVITGAKKYYEKIKNKDAKSAEYVTKAIRELEDALIEVQKSQ